MSIFYKVPFKWTFSRRFWWVGLCKQKRLQFLNAVPRLMSSVHTNGASIWGQDRSPPVGSMGKAPVVGLGQSLPKAGDLVQSVLQWYSLKECNNVILHSLRVYHCGGPHVSSSFTDLCWTFISVSGWVVIDAVWWLNSYRWEPPWDIMTDYWLALTTTVRMFVRLVTELSHWSVKSSQMLMISYMVQLTLLLPHHLLLH